MDQHLQARQTTTTHEDVNKPLVPRATLTMMDPSAHSTIAKAQEANDTLMKAITATATATATATVTDIVQATMAEPTRSALDLPPRRNPMLIIEGLATCAGPAARSNNNGSAVCLSGACATVCRCSGEDEETRAAKAMDAARKRMSVHSLLC
ncbi:hypothetical protein BGX31_007022 [Mortierella sp. GBA43]|nr:hypothetical protein BGX31_007022 [Mortierella sp. GBA43]